MISFHFTRVRCPLRFILALSALHMASCLYLRLPVGTATKLSMLVSAKHSNQLDATQSIAVWDVRSFSPFQQALQEHCLGIQCRSKHLCTLFPMRSIRKTFWYSFMFDRKDTINGVRGASRNEIEIASLVDLPTFATTASLPVEFSPTSVKGVGLFVHRSKHCKNTRTSRFVGTVVCFGVHAILAAAKIGVTKQIIVKAFTVELVAVRFLALAWILSGSDVLKKIRSSQWHIFEKFCSLGKFFRFPFRSSFRFIFCLGGLWFDRRATRGFTVIGWQVARDLGVSKNRWK